MGIQIIMDRNGDTRRQFDPDDAKSVALAKERYDELIAKGYRAVALADNGEQGEVLGGFDKTKERTLFIPQLKGG